MSDIHVSRGVDRNAVLFTLGHSDLGDLAFRDGWNSSTPPLL